MHDSILPYIAARVFIMTTKFVLCIAINLTVYLYRRSAVQLDHQSLFSFVKHAMLPFLNLFLALLDLSIRIS